MIVFNVVLKFSLCIIKKMINKLIQNIHIESNIKIAIDIMKQAADWRVSKGFTLGDTWQVQNINLEYLIRAYNATPDNFIVMFVNDNPIMTCILQDYDTRDTWPIADDNKKYYYISKLAVYPKYRGNGFADLFLNQIKRMAIQKKFDGIRLDVGAKQTGLLKLYVRNEFEKVGMLHSERTNSDWVLYEWNTRV
ncbi:MAG: GNAT family N-acetyltransferase [Rickettsiales bacterium]|nr:GNAT family N-acetyltransferase [Rickettsiales bacterium]